MQPPTEDRASSGEAHPEPSAVEPEEAEAERKAQGEAERAALAQADALRKLRERAQQVEQALQTQTQSIADKAKSGK